MLCDCFRDPGFMRPEPDAMRALAPQNDGQPGAPRARPDDGGAALLARLQDVVAQAQVAGSVLGADGSVDEITIALRAALDQLRGLRLEMTEAP